MEQYTTLKHRKAESTIKCYVKGGDKKPVGGGLSFLLNCEASPRVRKIVLASSASKLYLGGSLALSGGKRGLGRIRTIDCVLAQGCPIFGVVAPRGSSDVAKNAIPAIVSEWVMAMN